jgi:hypothetical protein
MGFGTDTQEWEAYGIPEGWENYIAGVGYNTDGESGASPAGCVDPCDAHLGLQIPVSIGPGGQVTVTVGHGYGGEVVAAEIGFDDPEQFPADGVPIIHALGDLDSNGTTDVAAAMPDLIPTAPGKLQVFRNLGTTPSGEWNGLVANTPITVGVEPSGIALGLFDGDPHLDMAVTHAGDDNVWIFRNNGTGDATFTVTHVIPIGNQPSAITSGLFNPDAFVDLAVTNELDNNVVILFGDGNGNFAVGGAAGAGTPIGQEPVGLLADDFDNNDDDDIAGASRGQSTAGQTGTVWVLRSNGDGTFQPPDYYDIGTNPKDISSGDVNRDTFVDIVVVNADDNTVSVLVNLGNGTFADAIPLPVGQQPLAIDAVDLDNDVDTDLVVVATIGVAAPPVRLVQVLENLILGPPDLDFGDPVDFAVNANANFVLAGDLNNDGYADLVTVNTNEGGTTGSVTVLLGNGESGGLPCPWDCQPVPDGSVNIPDFLALLAQWGGPGACDFDGNNVVDVQDFLTFLANFGPCP